MTVRKRARKARRAGTAGSAFGTGTLSRPFERLIDDPVPRNSQQSYFLQLADFNAYAAFRRLYPPPKRRVQICPEGMWDGSAPHASVRSGGVVSDDRRDDERHGHDSDDTPPRPLVAGAAAGE